MAQGGMRTVTTVALSLLLVSFWVVMHRYAGLDHDARIYAFQALSKLHPYLRSDLYLQNTSQDQFTIFSPFYAFCIDLLGLENAALLLTVVFTMWFMVATWSVARRVGSYELAWASAAAVSFTSGDYGAFGVFHFPEAYLTARLPAYALVATALALHLGDRKRLGLCVGAVALLVHPIMALPGVLLLLCLSFSVRISLVGAIAGIIFTLAIATAAAALPWMTRFITVIDPPWLEVVRERSQFLFLQLWSARDLEFNARPFLCLGVSALALTQPRERRLCVGALLIGSTGLLVTYIGGKIGPIAFLIQGQGWRWEWITCLVSVLLLPQTVYRIWSDEKCGPVCSILLISSWTFSVVDGTLCALLALLLWLGRRAITTLTSRHLRWAAMAFSAVILAWVVATSWSILGSTPPESGREAVVLTKLRDILGPGITASLLFGFIWYWIITRRSSRPLWACSAVLVAGLSYAVPRSFEQIETLDSEAYVAEFADWRSAIPPNSTVFVAPAQDAGKFVWFSLQRLNYLSPDQSAGVIFSRATALEVKRRSDVLTPIESPNWKYLSARSSSAAEKPGVQHHAALTAQTLNTVCIDPVLGFVMSRELVGREPLRRKDHGKWRGWNLYDCQSFRTRKKDAS